MPDALCRIESSEIRVAIGIQFSRGGARDGTERAGGGGEKHRNGARSLVTLVTRRRKGTILINIYLIKSLRVKGIVAAPRGRYLCRAVRG